MGNNFKTSFIKKVKSRIWVSAFIILLGVLTVGFIYYFDLFGSEQLGHAQSFNRGFYFGTGWGLIAAGILKVIKNVSYLKNEEKLKKAEIMDNDERIKFIGNKIWSISGYVMLILIYIAVIISGIYNALISNVLLTILGVFAFVIIIVKIILQKIY